ncbi:MAG TPA: MFS transporter [Gaiellaceae bacterium]
MRASSNLRPVIAAVSGAGGWAVHGLRRRVGGEQRLHVVLVLACVLGLSGADVATVGASATELRHALHIGNTQVGLLIAVSSLVGAVATLPFGVLADHAPRTRFLGGAVVLWAVAMTWSATVSSFPQLLLARLFLGAVTAAAGPMIASLIGDYFSAGERGRIYGFILAGELVGAGFGFAVTGDIAALSWRAAFVALALPALVVAWFVFRLPEPARGGADVLPAVEGADRQQQETVGPTDAQRLARDRRVDADEGLARTADVRTLDLLGAVRYVLRVRTNVVLIAASACGYYFLAGVETFGIEFAKGQYRIDQGLANVVLLVTGVGAVLGVLAGGTAGDALVRRGYLTGRIITAAVAATAAAILFVPAIFTRAATTATLYLIGAAFALSAQNPPLDAARLDIMPSQLWGRAEAIRTMLRSFAQALAPVVFGAVSDYVFGGGRTGLRWTFIVMLAPLAASAALLFEARKTYPADVATAAAARRAEPAQKETPRRAVG